MFAPPSLGGYPNCRSHEFTPSLKAMMLLRKVTSAVSELSQNAPQATPPTLLTKVAWVTVTRALAAWWKVAPPPRSPSARLPENSTFSSSTSPDPSSHSPPPWLREMLSTNATRAARNRWPPFSTASMCTFMPPPCGPPPEPISTTLRASRVSSTVMLSIG